MPPKASAGERKSRFRKHRVYQEEAKTRQTSHWDWDYLPLETLERLTRDLPVQSPDAPRSKPPVGRQKLALICIAAGILTIGGLLVLLVVFDLRLV